MNTHSLSELFPLGRTVITIRAQGELHPYDVRLALYRHARGDWGEIDPEDVAENERALLEPCRLISVYRDRHQTRFHIITEADRSITSISLPEENWTRDSVGDRPTRRIFKTTIKHP